MWRTVTIRKSLTEESACCRSVAAANPLANDAASDAVTKIAAARKPMVKSVADMGDRPLLLSGPLTGLERHVDEDAN